MNIDDFKSAWQERQRDVDADALEISADEVDGVTGKVPNTYRD